MTKDCEKRNELHRPIRQSGGRYRTLHTSLVCGQLNSAAKHSGPQAVVDLVELFQISVDSVFQSTCLEITDDEGQILEVLFKESNIVVRRLGLTSGAVSAYGPVAIEPYVGKPVGSICQHRKVHWVPKLAQYRS